MLILLTAHFVCTENALVGKDIRKTAINDCTRKEISDMQGEFCEISFKTYLEANRTQDPGIPYGFSFVFLFYFFFNLHVTYVTLRTELRLLDLLEISVNKLTIII